jgi:hypothetical protein
LKWLLRPSTPPAALPTVEPEAEVKELIWRITTAEPLEPETGMFANFYSRFREEQEKNHVWIKEKLPENHEEKMAPVEITTEQGMFHAFYEKYKTTDAGWIVGSVDRRVIVE